jgi:signal transduction histidine kinase
LRKTLFSKYFYICSSIILISTAFLGVVLLVFSVQYFRDDQYTLLERNVKQSVVLTNLNYSANGYKYVDPAYLQPFYQLQGQAIDADIFLVDVEGKTLLCSNTTSCTHVDYLLPSAVMERLKTAGDYRETGKLGGIYKTSYYTVGRPVVGSDGQTVGAVFASTSSAALTTFLVDIFQMYVISAALVMLFAFIVIYFVTSNMVRPLQDMLAATRSFSKGDFSIRVLVEGDDEVAMLAAAFNSMASSLAVMESTRRSFTANVSHELKTPMTTIGGFIDGILDGTIPPEKQSYYLRIVSGEVQRLSRMVRSMLSIARIEAGELTIAPVPVEITDIVTRTVFTFEQRIEEKGIEVRGLDAEKHLVEADADLIHQVVYNLVDNAVKFVQQGGYLEFGYRNDGGMTFISVKNSGEGVAPEEIPKLFDRFYKSDKSRSLDKNGVGLGLSIVKTIVNLHNGEIFVRSEPGQYTEFVFSLPTSQQNKKSLLFRKHDKQPPREAPGQSQQDPGRGTKP